MGLDMYIIKAKRESLVNPNDNVDFEFKEGRQVNFNGENTDELWYWRKCNPVHRWFNNLYIEKGGTDPEFNCNTVRVEAQDVLALLEASRKHQLKPEAGFFFGPTDYDEERWSQVHKDLVEMAEKLQPYLEDPELVVYYDSWW